MKMFIWESEALNGGYSAGEVVVIANDYEHARQVAAKCFCEQLRQEHPSVFNDITDEEILKSNNRWKEIKSDLFVTPKVFEIPTARFNYGSA